MNSVSYSLGNTAINVTLRYLNKDPEKNIPKIVDMLMPLRIGRCKLSLDSKKSFKSSNP